MLYTTGKLIIKDFKMKKTTLWLGYSFLFTSIIYFSSGGWLTLFSNASALMWREEFVLLSGVIAYVLMTLSMLIAARFAWLDRAMGGLDKAYGLHKWAGIFATLAVILHWLGENAPKWMVKLNWIAHPGLLGSETTNAQWQINLFKSGVIIGEWSFYLLVVFVCLALIQKVSYHHFRLIHKIFPYIYIASAYHVITAMLKTNWWNTPAAWLLVALSVIGIACAFASIFKQIGKPKKIKAVISRIHQFKNDLLEIDIHIPGRSFQHQAGQFAFVSFAHDPEPHPFTIASFGKNTSTLRFAIKALGDFTNNMFHQVQVGQTVELEGPYGQFIFNQESSRQIWIAGGIGITPFLSRLETLAHKHSQTIDLWYCAKDEANHAYPHHLDELCKETKVTLHRINSSSGKRLTAEMLNITEQDLRCTSIWFCGPQSFAETLKKDLRKMGFPVHTNFYQENFSWR